MDGSVVLSSLCGTVVARCVTFFMVPICLFCITVFSGSCLALRSSCWRRGSGFLTSIFTFIYGLVSVVLPGYLHLCFVCCLS